ncbi:MAG: transglycosylase domain-containing protein [Eubacterium sp.]|nr:transglycosylase domain-containing protein [Eubacterium sp.]
MNYSEKNVEKRAERLKSKWIRRGKRVQVLLLRLSFLLLVAGIGYASYLGWCYMRDVIAEVPDVKSIELIPTGYETHILDDDGETVQLLSSGDANREYVMLEQIPTDLQNAFIAIEDARFRSHEGIDPVEILRSFIVGLTNGGNFTQRTGTITQQLLKNQVFTGGEEKDFLSRFRRKFQEQYLALCMENRYSKDEILEYYLNTINLGQNTLGVEAASVRYFNKHVDELTLSECATLAGIAKNPTAYNPINHAGRNRTRELQVLTAMQDQGFITSDQYEAAIQDEVQTRIQRYNEEYTKNEKTTSYFTDALIRSVIEDMKTELGYTETQAANAIYTGGLSIYSTQDSQMQEICDTELNNPKNYPSDVKYQLEYQLTIAHPNGTQDGYNFSDLKKWYEEQGEPIKTYFPSEKDARAVISRFRRSMLRTEDRVIAESIRTVIQPQASFVLMDQSTGEIKALVGGRGEKLESMSFNRATDSTRQPGSVFNILSTYLPALDTAGMSLATVQDDSEYYYPGTDQLVRNWYGDSYRGLTPLRDAITNSINVISVKTLDQVTPKVGYDYLLNLGFTTLVDGYSDDAGRSFTDIALPMALGSLTKGVTNRELTGAFATIASGGLYRKPHLYSRIVDHDGKTLIDHSDLQSKRVMKETTAWLLTDAMEGIVTDIDAKHLAFRASGMAVAGKTGTSDNDNDLWFVGYTPYLTGGIWCGYDGNKSQKETTYHKDLWRKIMEEVSERYEIKMAFPKTSGLRTASICTKCGKLVISGLCEDAVGGSCSRLEFFTPETMPTGSCDCHVRCKICKSSGMLAGDGCPESDVYDAVYLQKKDEKAGAGKTMDSALIMPDYLIDSICDVHNSR